MAIDKRSTRLSTGEIIHYQYDKDGDLLEIFFQSDKATAAIELTDNLILRFDWEKCIPLSLGIISFSKLLDSAPYGERHFALLVEEWPEEAHDKIWQMLGESPLTGILKLSSYTPAHATSLIPITAVKQLPELVA